MKSLVTNGILRCLLALVALGAISGHTLPAGRWQAQTSYGVGGPGYAAVGKPDAGTEYPDGPAGGWLRRAERADRHGGRRAQLQHDREHDSRVRAGRAHRRHDGGDRGGLGAERGSVVTAVPRGAAVTRCGAPAPPVRRALRPPPSPRAASKTSSPVPARTRTRSDAPAG